MNSLPPRDKRGHNSTPLDALDALATVEVVPGDSFLVAAQPTLFVFESAPVVPADQHPAAVYLASLAQGSRRSQRTALEIIAGLLTGGALNAWLLPWAQLRHQHTAAVRAQLASRYAVSTARRMIAALKGVLRAAWRLGQMPTREWMKAVDLAPIRGHVAPKGRALDREEIEQLFAVCDRDASGFGARDAAVLVALYGAGLRREEAWALDVGDYDRRKSSLIVRKGKGNKARRVFLADGASARLNDWLDARGAWGSALFCPLRLTKDGGAKIYQRRLSQNALADTLPKRFTEAGVDALAPHDLRRTFITHLLEAGVDIVTVQKLVGHASVSTTGSYDRRGEETARQAVSKLQLPARQKGPLN